MAEARGLLMRQPPLQTRTRRAHETAAFATAHGAFEAVDRALFRAYFEHGRDINDVDVLSGIAADASLDPGALRRALEQGEFVEAVMTDVRLGARLGIDSVPTMLVGEPLEEAELVVGAVDADWLSGAIERALAGDRSYARLRRRFVRQLPTIE